MSLPDAFRSSMAALLGEADESRLAEVLNGEPTVSVRLNNEKRGQDAELFNGETKACVPWSSAGIYLDSRPKFTFDPLLHAGAYYVQEPSSMFLEQAFRTAEKECPLHRVLDLCAAPGGKSTLLRSLMKEGDLLVSNEPISKRASVLSENIQKWGNADVAVTCDFPKDFAKMENFFDFVATDVPCSGEGMFRKDEQAREEWSPDAVKMCAQRQREIVRDVWPALREGGFLAYSTCTFNSSEDEDNVKWIINELGAENVAIDVESDWHITGETRNDGLKVYHFFPHLVRGEGFFLALLRKKGDSSDFVAGREKSKARGNHNKSENSNNNLISGCKTWLNAAEGFDFHEENGSIFAVRKSLAPDYALLKKHAHVILAGVSMAVIKGRKIFPSEGLALCTQLNKEMFGTLETDYDEAVKYLRGETLLPHADTSRGAVLVTYKSLPLGFANNVGNRINNAYPANWRIRSGYIPKEAPNF